MNASDVPQKSVQVSVNHPGDGRLVWLPPEDMGCHFEMIAPEVIAQILAQNFAPALGKFLLILPAISRVDPSIGSIAMQELNTSLEEILSLLGAAEEIKAGVPAQA